MNWYVQTQDPAASSGTSEDVGDVYFGARSAWYAYWRATRLHGGQLDVLLVSDGVIVACVYVPDPDEGE